MKTPVGRTKREDIYNAITQGDNFGPILCSNQVDTFGRECLKEGKYTYTYRGEVDIPPLGMWTQKLHDERVYKLQNKQQKINVWNWKM